MIKKTKDKYDIHLDYLNKLFLLYSNLFSLSKTQMTALSLKNYKNAAKIIDEKEKYIERIKLLDDKFIKIKNRLNLELTNTNEKTEISNKISSIIKSTINLDNECKTILSSMKKESKDKFDNIIKGKKMLSGYYTGDSNVAKFISKKG